MHGSIDPIHAAIDLCRAWARNPLATAAERRECLVSIRRLEALTGEQKKLHAQRVQEMLAGH